MAWTEITRRKYRRDGLRYAGHLTDAKWARIEPLLPPASSLGRPRETDLRSVVNAILYMASTGCQWRQLPKEFPPYLTVQSYFYAWSREGVFARVNRAWVVAAREPARRSVVNAILYMAPPGCKGGQLPKKAIYKIAFTT